MKYMTEAEVEAAHQKLLENPEYVVWFNQRPKRIQKYARQYPGNILYHNIASESEQRVWLISYKEDGTCQMAVTRIYNFVAHERRVFGVKFEELKPIELLATAKPIEWTKEMIAVMDDCQKQFDDHQARVLEMLPPDATPDQRRAAIFDPLDKTMTDKMMDKAIEKTVGKQVFRTFMKTRNKKDLERKKPSK